MSDLLAGAVKEIGREVCVHGCAVLCVLAAPSRDGAALAVEVVEESGAALVVGEVFGIVDDNVEVSSADDFRVCALLLLGEMRVLGIDVFAGLHGASWREALFACWCSIACWCGGDGRDEESVED